MKENAAVKSNDPLYYKHRNFFVGLFVLIPLLIVPVLLVFALVKSEILEKRMKLYIRCETASGLKETTPVNILGKKVGNIHSFSLNEKGHVDVIIQIKERYSHMLHRDSKAKLRQKNFVVGDWEIDLTMGTGKEGVKNGDTLEVEYQIRLEELTEWFSQMIERFTKMMKPLESIFESLDRGEGIIKYIFGEDTLGVDVRILLDRVNHVFTRVDKTLVHADRMISNLTKLGDRGIEAVDSLMVLSENVDVLIKDLNVVVSDLDSLVTGFDNLPGDVDRVVDLLEKDLEEAEILLKGIQNHWFFRRTMKKQRELELKENKGE